MPVVRSRPCGSCWRLWSSRVCWFKPTSCTRKALFVYLAQHSANFLIAVKNGRRKGVRLIRDRLSYGRRITWCLRAMSASNWVVEQFNCQAARRSLPCAALASARASRKTRRITTSLLSAPTGATRVCGRAPRSCSGPSGNAGRTDSQKPGGYEHIWNWVRDVQLREDAHRYR